MGVKFKAVKKNLYDRLYTEQIFYRKEKGGIIETAWITFNYESISHHPKIFEDAVTKAVGKVSTCWG